MVQICEAVRRDFDNFRKGGEGEKSVRLVALEKALKKIPPTSVEPERAFSAASQICTKIRSRLADATLDDLIYGKTHLLSKFKKQ